MVSVFFSTKNLSPEGKVWPTCMCMYVVPALVKIQAAATKIYILVESDQKKSADDHQWLQPFEFALIDV